jgi:glycosyltransferase involved in cell wall biosynthesis
MHILHIVESFGGGVLDFIKILSTNIEGSHTIVYSIREETPENFKELFPPGVKFIHWKSASREIHFIRDVKGLIELIKILKNLEKSIDVIHLHSSKAGFIGRLAARILGLNRKVIYTTHGISFLRQDVSYLKKNVFILLEKLAYRFGGIVVACSKSEAEFIQLHGIPAIYIYNGIKCSRINHRQVKKDNKIRIVTVGRITYQKNPYLFRKIASKFLEERNIEFIWIGDGELKSILNLPNISITGWISQKEVLNILLNADIYLSTSLWEGLPLSVLQAMCAKLPLILHRSVGNIDLVEDNYNGYSFKKVEEAVDKIKELIKNPKQRKIWGANSYRLVINKFNLKNMIEEYRKLYTHISDL